MWKFWRSFPDHTWVLPSAPLTDEMVESYRDLKDGLNTILNFPHLVLVEWPDGDLWFFWKE